MTFNYITNHARLIDFFEGLPAMPHRKLSEVKSPNTKTVKLSRKDIDQFCKAVQHLESFWFEMKLPQAIWLEPIIDMAFTLDDSPNDEVF